MLAVQTHGVRPIFNVALSRAVYAVGRWLTSALMLFVLRMIDLWVVFFYEALIHLCVHDVNIGFHSTQGQTAAMLEPAVRAPAVCPCQMRLWRGQASGANAPAVQTRQFNHTCPRNLHRVV